MSSHYDINRVADSTSYQFITSSGITYIAYFTEFTLLGMDGEEINVVSFGFTCDKTTQVKRHDGKVRQTIIKIIEGFFSLQPSNAVLYMCMDSDGKGRNRYITFGRWFREANRSLEKHNFASTEAEVGFYSSIILKAKNPDKEKLILAFYHTINYWGLT